MKFKWFNRPSIYFRKYPNLLKDCGAVSSFLSELEDLLSALWTSVYIRNTLAIIEIEAEIKWLKENRLDNKIKFD